MIIIDAAGHYLYYPEGWVVTFSLIFMETLRFVIFFLVCYYFTTQAASLLPDPEKYLNWLKILLVLNLAWCITGAILNFISYSASWETYSYLC
jgi:hypothetical protein